MIFQCTHPLRDATYLPPAIRKYCTFQSTHPLRDATLFQLLKSFLDTSISIHAPLTGCDPDCSSIIPVISISIHAPLTGCDSAKCYHVFYDSKFQSTHPLRDATSKWQAEMSAFYLFQSTHPLRDATWYISVLHLSNHNFNPRTPYGMRPPLKHSLSSLYCNFNPRTPYGMRHISGVDLSAHN